MKMAGISRLAWVRSVRALTLVAACAISASAGADTIYDTTPSWNGTTAIGGIGNPNTATYGQTFAAPTDGDDVLNSFTFYLSGSATLHVQALVYAWAGSLSNGSGNATGTPLFTSSTFTISPSNNMTPYTVNTGGVSLTAGSNYVALFTISGPDSSNYSSSTGGDDIWGFLGSTPAGTGNGSFVFNNNGSNFAALTSPNSWSEEGDSAFTATFSASQPTPEPASIALFGAGLSCTYFARRRRRQS